VKDRFGNAHGCAQNAENIFGFDLLGRHYKDGDELLDHNLRVTGDETWVSFVNAETKEQPKDWKTHMHLIRQKYLNRKGVLMVENSCIDVLQ
jgi:hypothetical protein